MHPAPRSLLPPDWPHFHRPATDPSAPALLLLHGTGGTEHDLVGLADRLSPGSAILAPRGRVSEHGASRYFARLAEGVFDPAEVAARTRELADFLVAALRHYKLDTPAARLTAVGFSNGANVAATLLQLRPDVPLAGAILLRPMVVLDQSAAPASLAGRRVLLLNGAHDPIVPLDHPSRLAGLLRAGGAELTTHLHAQAGHGLITDDLRLASDFLAPSRA
ncbi:MAG: alpha/beta hydrolase [Burkholderiales bacterium]|nr:alpha/beta hydrolase [Opitutaceae bacterium]